MFIHTVPRRNDVATITLSIPLLLDSSEPEQTFLLQYDPDNITSATDAQGTADHHVPLGRLPTESDPPLHTLSLHLRDPCVVWSPCQQPKAPKSGSATAYEELVELVKAMAVHIVFDYRKLRHPRLQQCYRLFVDEPKKLTAFDFLQLSDKGFFRYDWRTFAPADSAPTANSAPPAYAETLDKRSRPGKSRQQSFSLADQGKVRIPDHLPRPPNPSARSHERILLKSHPDQTPRLHTTTATASIKVPSRIPIESSPNQIPRLHQTIASSTFNTTRSPKMTFNKTRSPKMEISGSTCMGRPSRPHQLPSLQT
jgi:hypothetical protein